MNKNELIEEIKKWIPDLKEAIQCMDLNIKMKNVNRIDMDAFTLIEVSNSIKYLISEYEKERAKKKG